MSSRSRALQRAFEILYGPLVFLHEPAGVCLFGASWRGRREAIARSAGTEERLLDIGCGAGQLLAAIDPDSSRSVGVDVSWSMLRRARRRGQQVVLADARRLPFTDGSFAAVVCSYPGPWIMDEGVWAELFRVTRSRSTLTILFGGTVTRGFIAPARSALIRLLYGPQEMPDLEQTTVPYFTGRMRGIEDKWGCAYVWEGRRSR